eukprot:TRINITY_DN1673_c0_g1_i1.p2 TRINITY_DN1673_c0_g1~~TRINITY_DN1673_c0_g1_i1.p2  ORF type:complete len:324 (+),score=89.17 TRINITY_DN1673_c0_g1_i1:84-974(+)
MPAGSDQVSCARAVGTVLSDVCTANAKWAVEHSPEDIRSCFECQSPPPISVVDYMKQVERTAGGKFWWQCLILIDELSRLNGVPISHKNVHRLVLTAYSLVLKVCLDGTGVSRCVSQDGGVSVHDLVEMESAFLELLGWRAIVGAAAYEMLKAKIHIVQDTARAAAARPSGPVTLIPAVLVPREVRFDLKATVPAAPKKGSQQPFRRRSHCPSGTTNSEADMSAAGPVVPRAPHVPTPPKKSSSASSLRRLREDTMERSSHTPPATFPRVGRDGLRHSAGARIASARCFAQECEQA